MNVITSSLWHDQRGEMFMSRASCLIIAQAHANGPIRFLFVKFAAPVARKINHGFGTLWGGQNGSREPIHQDFVFGNQRGRDFDDVSFGMHQKAGLI